MNNIFERIEIAESLGYISYGNCSDTPEQKTIAKWWNAENPSALVELPTLNELTIEKLERELADMTERRDALAKALRKCILWAECMSMRCERDRDNMNWSYLNDAREALAAAKGGSDARD